ncbi:efflux RND transporter periplasmic adaptor subunit [Myxococcota bacterium]|nr:efflux RND transporter periplasmic adaptor subunit [Myxococcota bacterium]
MSARRLLALALLAAACSKAPPEKGGEKHEHEKHEAHGDEHEAHGDEHDEHAEAESDHVELTPEAAARITVTTAPVEARDLLGEIVTTAEVGFDQDHLAHVTPRLGGRVHEVRGNLGQRVAPGEVLAVIDSTELGRARAEYLQARSQANLAAQSLARQEELAREQIVSAQALAQARAEDAEARSRLDTAREMLRLYGLDAAQIERTRSGDARSALFEVRAPIPGQIVEKHLTRGELVDPEHRLFTIAETGRVWIWIDVYERDLGRVHMDDTAEVRLDAFPERLFRGKVSFVAVQVDPATRTGRARIEVENPDGLLRPGMFARVRLTDPHAAANGRSLVIPAAAVQRTPEGPVAFVQEGERKYERRRLRLGRKTPDYVEVLDGLQPAEPVVVQGAFLLKSEAAKGSMGGGHEH